MTLAETRRLVATAAPMLSRAFLRENLRLRAMALTYISLFALVPALVVAFSVVQSLTGTDALWKRIDEFLLENLAVGARASIGPYLDRVVRNAHATSVGLVGAAILVYSGVSLFGYVEKAMNDIWAVHKRRPVAQRALVYWAGLTLAPLLLAVSLALGHAVQSRLSGAPVGQALAGLGSLLLPCVLLATMYLVVPATRVRLLPAAAGGLVAGLAWTGAKALYTWAVARFFHYNAIYGSVAAVPIFIVWLYLSWLLVLFGARVAFVVQHARLLLRGHEPDPTLLGKELLAARAMLDVALAFERGESPPDPGDVALRLQALGEPVREVLEALRDAELVAVAAEGGVIPARPIDRITLADVRRAVSGLTPASEETPEASVVWGFLAGAEGAAMRELAEVSFADLCRRLGARLQLPAERDVALPGP